MTLIQHIERAEEHPEVFLPGDTQPTPIEVERWENDGGSAPELEN